MYSYVENTAGNFTYAMTRTAPTDTSKRRGNKLSKCYFRGIVKANFRWTGMLTPTFKALKRRRNIQRSTQRYRPALWSSLFSKSLQALTANSTKPMSSSGRWRRHMKLNDCMNLGPSSSRTRLRGKP